MLPEKLNQKQFIKNHTWIMNHEQIFKFIDDLLCSGKMPTITDISKTLGLTRKTVYEHLKSIPLLNENKELTTLRRNMLLEKIYNATSIYNNIDFKAVELYLKYTNEDKTGIKINNLTINQTIINNLDTEKKMKLIKLLSDVENKDKDLKERSVIVWGGKVIEV